MPNPIKQVVLSLTPSTNRISTNQATAGIFVSILGGVLILALLILAPVGAPEGEGSLHVCLVLVGLTCGWLLGIMASPDDAEEQSRFSRFSTAFGTLLTGFVLSQLDVKRILQPEFWDPATGFKLLLFVGSLLVAALVTYSLREYILPSSDTAVVPVAEEHEFVVAPGTVGVLDCCSDLPDTARLRLHVLSGDGMLHVARNNAQDFTATTFPPTERVSLKSHSLLEVKVTDAGTKGRRLSLHNTGSKPARVSVAVLTPATTV